MTIEDFKEKFYAPMIGKRNVKLEDLKPETKFMDLGFNSLDMIEIAMDFEKIFNIEIPDEDIDKLITVGSAEKYIKTMLNIN